MLTKIQIIILVLSLIDLTASYFYISTFHNKFPKQDPTVIEANPILKMSIKHFGILKGIIFGGLIIFALVILLVLSMKPNFHYFLAGAFTIMILYHVLNFNLLRGT